MILCDTSREVSFGREFVARVMVSEYQSPRGSEVRANGFVHSANGALNGSDVRELCERLRTQRLGRAQKLSGREASWLWDRSRLERIVRSAKESGRKVNWLFRS